MKTPKKILIPLALASVMSVQTYALSIDSVADKVVGGIFDSIDEKFNGLFKESLSLIETCYDADVDLNLDNLDVCEIAGELDKIQINVCSLIGGSGTKNVRPINGVQRLCNNKAREFKDYVSKTASDAVEYSVLDSENLDFASKLPSGKTMREFLKGWDINEIFKDDSPTNVVANYLKNGNMKAVALFMEYAKLNNKEVSQLKIEDLQAPANLEEYKKGVVESTKTHKSFLDSTNLNNITSLAKAKMQGVSDKSSAGSEVVKGYKKEFDLAKNAEIAYTLANADYQKIAIPTQEYVSSLRIDLQPEAIAQIRKQQAYESATINKITEKWERKYSLAKLLADKEAILAQSFDEQSAKSEIEQIIASASSSGTSGILP